MKATKVSSNKMFSKLGLYALILFIAAAVAISPLVATDTQAQSTADDNVRSITVVGDGMVSIKPDLARASIGVDVTNASVQEAVAENRAMLTAVLDALREAGIEEEDIQTAGFAIYAERYGPEGPRAESDVTYRVTNNVSVRIRDLDSVGAVLDAAVEAGANNIYGVDFVLDDDTEAKANARTEAIANAESKAQDIAELAGVELGNVLTISEIIGSGGGMYMAGMSQDFGMGAGGNGTISPGELDIRYQIQITYEIKD